MVLDLSGSMNYVEKGVSRLHFSKILLASLTYLGYRQSDLLSLYSLKNNELQALVPAGKKSFERILYTLENAEANGTWQNENPKFPQFHQRQKELVIFVSDFLQIGDEWLKVIKNIANPRRDVLVFQVLGSEELDFNLKGFYRFKDLETGKELELEAEAVKAEFKKNAETYLNNLEESLRIPNVHLVRTTLHEPIANVIAESLRKRKI
jgi:uncharacterized protein (DUF58 family)